nr:putative copia-type protein [Tanacetum cinerariifolium]
MPSCMENLRRKSIWTPSGICGKFESKRSVSFEEILIWTEAEEMTRLRTNLFKEFEMKDLGRQTGMIDCKPVDTPIMVNQKLYMEEKAKLANKGRNLVTWRSKKQKVVALSSAEADVRGIARGLAEALWIRKLLSEIGYHSTQTSKIMCDNKAAIQISENPVQHDRIKHIVVDRHFIKEKLENGIIELLFVRSKDQLADILTNAELMCGLYGLIRSCVGLFTSQKVRQADAAGTYVPACIQREGKAAPSKCSVSGDYHFWRDWMWQDHSTSTIYTGKEFLLKEESLLVNHETGDGTWDSWFMSLFQQTGSVCDQVKNIPQLTHGFNFVGLSQILDSQNFHQTPIVMFQHVLWETFGYMCLSMHRVVLFELINGRRPEDLSSDSDSLINWARPILVRAEEGTRSYEELVDKGLENNYDREEMYRMVLCVAACFRYSARQHPKMSQVVREVESDASLDDLNDGATSGGMSSAGSSEVDLHKSSVWK